MSENSEFSSTPTADAAEAYLRKNNDSARKEKLPEETKNLFDKAEKIKENLLKLGINKVVTPFEDAGFGVSETTNGGFELSIFPKIDNIDDAENINVLRIPPDTISFIYEPASTDEPKSPAKYTISLVGFENDKGEGYKNEASLDLTFSQDGNWKKWKTSNLDPETFPNVPTQENTESGEVDEKDFNVVKLALEIFSKRIEIAFPENS